MPSLPTSLILVGLVFAWLVVLVPMVARRREHVPENDESGVGYRVLETKERAHNKQPVLSRTAFGRRSGHAAGERDGTAFRDRDDFADDFGDDFSDAGTAGVSRGRRDDAEFGDAASRDGEYGGSDDADREYDDHDYRAAAYSGRYGDAAYYDDAAYHDDAGYHDGAYDDAGDHAYDDETYGDAMGDRDSELTDRDDAREAARDRTEVSGARVGDRRRDDSFDDETSDGGMVVAATDRFMADRYGAPEPAAYGSRGEFAERPWQPDDVVSTARAGVTGGPGRRHTRYDPSDERHRPVPVRGGRGGYDPQAAAQLSSYRFQRRRRVVLVLAAIAAIGCAVGGIFAQQWGWITGASSGVLLVLYFAYLRRQVRIEEDIRARRAARMMRARQIRPEFPVDATAPMRGGAPRSSGGWSYPEASVPPQYHHTGVPVDFDDSDPAFDDLEYYDPMPYRRAAGQ